MDQVLVMTVNPGFGNQHFLESTLPKIRRVRGMIERVRPGADLEVDGGIDASTLLRAHEAGARVFVAGTSIFGHPGGVAEGVRSLRAAGR